VRFSRSFVAILAGILACRAALAAQPQATITTPYHNLGDGFFERMGVGFGFHIRGLSGNVGGNMVTPPFGGFDPSAGLTGGFGIHGPGVSGRLGFSLAQGSRQGLISQTPSVTTLNGYPAYFGDASLSPFVMGYVPVVGGVPRGSFLPMVPPYVPDVVGAGDYPTDRLSTVRRMLAGRSEAESEPDMFGVAGPAPAMPAAAAVRPAKAAPPPREAAVSGGATDSGGHSSASRAAPGVAEARRLHELDEQSQNGEAQVLIERGISAEDNGKPNVAKIYYRQAVKRATGTVRQQAIDRLKALDAKR
jgi:hypothetical protein